MKWSGGQRWEARSNAVECREVPAVGADGSSESLEPSTNSIAPGAVVVPEEIESMPARRDVSEGMRDARIIMDAAECP